MKRKHMRKPKAMEFEHYRLWLIGEAAKICCDSCDLSFRHAKQIMDLYVQSHNKRHSYLSEQERKKK